MGRYDLSRKIASLDPERDHLQIMHYLAGYEFPWDYIRALEMALYRTFCAPTISALLDKTREFHDRPQRRYDDTALLMAEIMEWGYDSDRGRESLRRINRFHRTYDIANEDFLYVLSTFHLEPIRWIAKYGWRPLTANEITASYFLLARSWAPHGHPRHPTQPRRVRAMEPRARANFIRLLGCEQPCRDRDT